MFVYLEKTVNEGTEHEHMHYLCVERDDYERDVDAIPCLLVCTAGQQGTTGCIERRELRKFMFCSERPHMFCAPSAIEQHCMEQDISESLVGFRETLERMRKRGQVQ